ncbi:heme o synthase [Desmospora activa]|uniref:Protoheme IX farnesyltransferase n=1 Tax=Desmospora activa DSM 45169 TaxID=1121389 RepID=A0A2T4Z3H4_9BACL|nr:heme o synthase [Desmospora activa]PTM56435.1 protoheme IX farnesyltransferase [Desmospora activa DSM 45169]
MNQGTETKRGGIGESPSGLTTIPLWKDYLSLVKPGITFSNLMAMVTGFGLASGGHGDLVVLMWTLLGTGLVVAGGCAWNNAHDRDIDQLMIRTRLRPVPAGRIPWRHARRLGWCFSLLGTLILGRYVNGEVALWGAAGVVWYVLIYTAWLKRVTPWNTVLGGVAGAVPPVIGWMAVTGKMDAPAWALFLLLFFWQPPHFYALALLKEEEYRRADIPMWPVIRGWRETWEQMAVFGCILLPVSLLFPTIGVVSWGYVWMVLPLGLVFAGLIVAGRWVKDRDRWAQRVFQCSLVYLVGWMVATVAFAG